MDYKKVVSLLTILCLAFCSKSFAQTTPWKSCIGGRERFIIQPTDKPCEYISAIEVELYPGWKSFWRNPGSSGMKPEINVDNGKATILYPTPVLYKQQDNEWENIYTDHLLLPVKISSTDKCNNISGNLHVCFCKNMCIPVELQFNFTNITSNLLEQYIIDQAFAGLPKEHSKNISFKAIKQTPQGIQIVYSYKNIDPKKIELFLDAGDKFCSLPILISKNNHHLIFETKCSKLIKGANLFYTLKTDTETISNIIKLNSRNF